jgi:magnesium-transporting ATPase (P-type)
MSEWYQKEVEEVFEKLNSSASGITNQEAKNRLKHYGSNIIKENS